ncbi:hypothetical protein L218DRAFT_996016 [Marasmius fiardii PR-910]|nr:hypothetical protein L218DRAFT_996016 [Marasmius fiardii PR-910]
MSVHKYANLPDIDTAPDVYETEDVAPSSQTNKDSSDEEGLVPTRSHMRGKITEASKEGLDSSNLPGAEEASKRFRRAEKRRGSVISERARTHYIYPPSPTSSDDEDDASRRKHVSLSHRLKSLQADLQSLEAELADPSNPLLQEEKEEGQVDAGELIRGLVDVRRRLEKVRKEREGRGKLVGVVIGQPQRPKEIGESTETSTPQETEESTKEDKPANRTLADMDGRVATLEKLIGSAATPLEETSPLPPPLLPQISRLSAQLGVLTQPRHIDSISRRLKLLLSELERTNQHRRHGSQPNVASNPSMQEQILPLLSRLGPSLPQIPHILMRLKTLSALHISASEFENTLSGLEEEQRKMRDSIVELESAVTRLETNLEENRRVVTGNVTGLEERVGALMERTK